MTPEKELISILTYGSEEMAKKAKYRSKKNTSQDLPENVLPQNILAVGERAEENKEIYISQAVYKAIHRFTRNKITNESGGMLLGSVCEEFGKINIIIDGFVEAKYCEATPTTLKFTHETWEYVHKEIEKKHKGKKIVGWIHTHPDFGIFLSEYDKFIHQNFFNEEYQLAYVIDPIQGAEGFYFWLNEKLEKGKGFFVYDKAGVRIDVDANKDEQNTKEEKAHLCLKNILLAVLSIAVVFLIFSNFAAYKKLEKIEQQQRSIVDTANQALAEMRQTILFQEARIDELRQALIDGGIVSLSEAGETPTEPITEDNLLRNEEAVGEATDESAPKSTDDVEAPETSAEGGTASE